MKALLLAASLAGGAAISTPVPVFEAYVGYPPCFRQPLLLPVSTDGQKLVASTEGRNSTQCSSVDGYPKYIVFKSSSDGGKTWGPLVTMFEGNPDYLAATFEPQTSTIHLFVQENASSTLYSAITDAGASYTPLRLQNPVLPAGVTSTIPAVGTGLAVSSDLCGESGPCGSAGNVMVPFVCHGKASAEELSRMMKQSADSGIACPGCFSCLLTSNDTSEGWYLSAVSSQEGTREANPVQLLSDGYPSASDAVIYLDERNMGTTACKGRLRAVSLDGGKSFDPKYNALITALPDVCTP